MFRNSSVSSRRSNLVIFLTPHIVHGASDLAKIYKVKLKERDKLLDAIYGESYKDTDFYHQMPNEEDGLYRPTNIDKAEDEELRKRQIEISKILGHTSDSNSNMKSLRNEGEVRIPMNVKSFGDESPVIEPVQGSGVDSEDK